MAQDLNLVEVKEVWALKIVEGIQAKDLHIINPEQHR